MAALGEADAEAVVAAAVAKAKADDGAMLRCLVARILPIARSRPVELEVPEGCEGDLRAILDATLRGLVQGEILPDEALMIARALEKAARALAAAPSPRADAAPENSLYPPAEPASSSDMTGLPHPEQPPLGGGVSKGPAIRGRVSGAKRRRSTAAARISRLERANPRMPGSPSPANRLYPHAESAPAPATASHVMAGLPHPDEEPPPGGVSKGPAIHGLVSSETGVPSTAVSESERPEIANPWMPGSSPGMTEDVSSGSVPPPNPLYSPDAAPSAASAPVMAGLDPAIHGFVSDGAGTTHGEGREIGGMREMEGSCGSQRAQRVTSLIPQIPSNPPNPPSCSG